MPFAEVVLSNAKLSDAISGQVAAGKMRKVGLSLYTTNMRDSLEAIVSHLCEASGF